MREPLTWVDAKDLCGKYLLASIHTEEEDNEILETIIHQDVDANVTMFFFFKIDFFDN